MEQKRAKKLDAGVKSVIADATNAARRVGAAQQQSLSAADAALAASLARGKRKGGLGDSKTGASGGGGGPGGLSTSQGGGVSGTGGVPGGPPVNPALIQTTLPMVIDSIRTGLLDRYYGATGEAARRAAARQLSLAASSGPNAISTIDRVDALFDLFDTKCCGRLDVSQMRQIHQRTSLRVRCTCGVLN
jgi:hypothetical protein